jgi:NADH-quinone oxidoreductase subunit E
LLTEEEKKEILEEIKLHPRKQAACVEAMKIVQRNRGWVSDEVRDIAELLDMSPAEIEGVATFFSHIYTRPVGKYMIFVCDSISCWIKGSDCVQEHLAKRLGIKPGETTADEQFTLMPIACLGICEQAPAMLIDNELYTELTPEKIDEILKKYE